MIEFIIIYFSIGTILSIFAVSYSAIFFSKELNHVFNDTGLIILKMVALFFFLWPYTLLALFCIILNIVIQKVMLND